MNLSSIIKKIGNTYLKEKKSGNFTEAPVGKLVRDDLVQELKKIEELKGFKIKGSIGNGQFASIPWVAMMNKEITSSTTKGIDIVFLFSGDGNKVYLTLNQGSTFFKNKNLKEKEILKISRLIYELIDSPETEPISIDLKSTTPLGKSYEKTTISGFEYDINDMPSSIAIKKDIIKLLNDYKQIVTKYKENGNDIEQFYRYVFSSKYNKYQLFKNLFENFVKQSQNNIISDKKSNVIPEEGLESVEIKKIKDYNSICIDNNDFHVHLFNSGQYGRKDGNGSGKIPYICYQSPHKKWITIRTTFENYKMIKVSITIWDELKQVDQKTGRNYNLKDMNLFSSNSPNDYFKQFYDDYISYKNESDVMGEKDFVKDLNKKLMKSKNIILRGSPGTGKSYLSKAIASELIGTAIEELEDSDQFEFVQFHPSYDYTDFVEGIRPTVSQTGEMGFELRSGIFKEFCSKAARSLNNSENKKFVFVIDEINRGEISKIFGELFFSIDPSYRGKKGSVKTQYTNMEKSKDKFYIPDNVYIIGTMNDIDRSIDTFDFAMRRRFRFIKIEANENTQMLATLGDKKDEAIDRMIRLNEAISSVEELNSNYHIGAAYFLKLRDMTFEELWKDYLQPLLADYIRGMFNEEDIMNKFESAYYSNTSELGENNEEA
ncbi:MrcB family domain-containing protein [Staphylococcus epidermidis]|uniref:DUF3578 domain-containing protein n=1 Tax=Staphylococcus haemolyticus TaxID=1283 RepID=A0A2K0AYL0_STAHA|nr:DUF3578 domain-containing protein [Staphylococcus sp. HMSC072D04]MCG1265143.1 DUF3578 domain-containing protein [Staphylococcus epidermidis]OFP91968.1 endonuclease [Staphylococcus sp. HMSC072D04]PNN30111.1 DUF3578 domain-containing protein [Staphylococcus haemolyticus]